MKKINFLNRCGFIDCMDATIVSFRRSKRIVSGNQLIITLPKVTNRESAAALIGKKVTWTAPGKNKTTISGVISAAHGAKGALRVVFERGLPGQSLLSKVIIT